MDTSPEPTDKDHTSKRKVRAAGINWFRARYRAAELVFILLIAILTGLACLAVWSNYQLSGWNSDTAAWAQVAGSIIAIAGAAWLAGGEARYARRWRREQGEEAAWAVRFVIAQAQFEAHIIAAEITNAEKVIDAVTTRSWRQRSANAALALQAMLSRIDHIHPAVVVSACNAKVLVDDLTSDLELFEKEKTDGKEVPQVIVRDIVEVHRNLAELLEQFDLRMDGARDALDRGGDMLPVREWSDRKRSG